MRRRRRLPIGLPRLTLLLWAVVGAAAGLLLLRLVV
jgi:hypothetical protein